MTEPEIITVTIAHKCGHTHTYSFPGPRRIFHRSEDHMAKMQCEACRIGNAMRYTVPKTVVTKRGDKIQIAVVKGSHPFREELKSKGYSRVEDYSQENPKASVFVCSKERAKSEIEWMRGMGWEIDVRETLQDSIVLS